MPEDHESEQVPVFLGKATGKRFGARDLFLASHTVVVMMAITIVETRLKDILLSKMRPDLSNNLSASLFEGYGPLGSFSARIDLAFAFGLIEPHIRADLRTLKDIRNAFAHSATMRHLNDKEIDHLFQKFKQYKKAKSNLELLQIKLAEVLTALWDGDADQAKIMGMFFPSDPAPKP